MGQWEEKGEGGRKKKIGSERENYCLLWFSQTGTSSVLLKAIAKTGSRRVGMCQKLKKKLTLNKAFLHYTHHELQMHDCILKPKNKC